MWRQLWLYTLILLVSCGGSGCQRGIIPLAWQRSLVRGQQDPTRALETALQQARLLQQAGRVDQALQTLLAFNQQKPGNPKILNQIGICYDLLGDYQRAQEIFRQILAVDPANLPVRNNLGYSYLLAGDYDRAQEELQQVLHQEPGNQRARNNLALAWMKQGRVAEAQQLWAAAEGTNKAKELMHQAAAQLHLSLPTVLAARETKPGSQASRKEAMATLAKNEDPTEEEEGTEEALLAQGSPQRFKTTRKLTGGKLTGNWPRQPLRERLLKVEAARPMTAPVRPDFLVL